MDPLKVYDLGQQGVQLVVTPLHQKSGSEVIRAQNAIYDRDSDAGGLTKRGGAAKVNAAALNSGATVKGGLHVAFADPTVPLTIGTRRGIYVSISTSADSEYSQSGAAWAGTVITGTPPNPEVATLNPRPANGNDRVVSNGVGFPGRIYFICEHTGTATYTEIWRWDGLRSTRVARIAAPPQTGAGSATDLEPNGLVALEGAIYFGTNDGNAVPFAFGRAFKLDPATDTVVQLGTSSWGTHAGGLSGGAPTFFAFFAGRLWVATMNTVVANTPKIYSIRPGVDLDWTLEETGTAGHTFTGLQVYAGNLYASTSCLNTVVSSSLIRKRTPISATWTTVRTNGSAANMNGELGLAVIGGLLTFVERDQVALTDNPKLWSYNGSAFTQRRDIRAVDLVAASVIGSGQPLTYDGAVYYPFTNTTVSVLLRSTDGITYTNVRTGGVGTLVRDILGVLRD